MNLIDKDKVVAEIKKRKAEAESNCGGYKSYEKHIYNDCIVDFYEEFLEMLDTFETKECDLEKELEKLDRILYDLDGVAIAGATHYLTVEDVKDIAKRFYEMGLNARKEE